MGETTAKKDILELDYKEITVPQAIAITLGAASKCTTYKSADQYNLAGVIVDDIRLQELMDKLEARVQDELDTKVEVLSSAPEPDPDEEAVDEGDIFIMEGGDVLNVKGVIYQKSCNKTVIADPDPDVMSFCIKQWDHMSTACEDMEGNEKIR